jgi:hypothetical protein
MRARTPPVDEHRVKSSFIISPYFSRIAACLCIATHLLELKALPKDDIKDEDDLALWGAHLN